MRLVRAWLIRLSSVFRKKQRDAELSAELESHLQLHIEDNLRAGMAPERARREALMKLGGVEQTKERYRDVRGIGSLSGLVQDFRYAARGLGKSPGFLLVVVFSLALGVGANTTIFSVISALLYRPLPYEGADRMVVIWETPAGHPEDWQPPPIAELQDWQKQNDVFEDIALTSSTERSIFTDANGPERVRIQDVTPNFFDLLHVKPILGRIFQAEEMQQTTQAVVISYSFWMTHFRGDPRVLGRSFTNHNTEVASTVVGVMPEGFAPFYDDPVDLWQPINPADARYEARQDHWLMPVARLKPGVTLAQAQSEMNVIAQRLEKLYPETNKGIGKKLVPLHEQLYGWARQPLYPLLGAVAFVLLIACANVANLMQSRTEIRRNEYALRASLGASRSRLMRQLFAESALLAVIGGSAGFLLSWWGIRLFRSLAGDFPSSEHVRLDERVLFFTLGISLLTAFLFGLIPALQASRPNLNDALREGARRTAFGSRSRARHVLAVCEVALAMVLLIGAGLMINSMLRLQHVNPGFDSKGLLTIGVELPEGGRYMRRVPGGDMEEALPASTAFFQQLEEKIAALPGVESVGSTTGLPTHFSERYTFSILGHDVPPADQRPRATYNQVTQSIFRTLRIPLKKGRYLDEHDTASSPWAIVVNETFAREFFPNEDPIGQQILLRYDPYLVEEQHPRQIVGVVGDVKQDGLGQPAPPFVYASFYQQPAVYPGGAIVEHLWQDLVIRPAPGIRAEDLTAEVKKIISDLDPDQGITHVMTVDEVMTRSTGQYQFNMQVLGIFAGIAVFLAVMGIYGVMSYFVNARRQEIGIRMALGAKGRDVVWMVTSTGLKLALIGVAIGGALSFGLTRLITSFLYDVTPTDPTTYGLVAIVLIAVALLACIIPARRGARVDPMVALRYE